jgi:hypothetical protein
MGLRGVKVRVRILREELPSLIANALYWIHRRGRLASPAHLNEGLKPMTYLEVVFRYSAIPGENEMRAIDAMREVYGIRRVQFNEKDGTVRVEFDASRLKQDGVARLLRNAGVDVGEAVALA